MATPIKILSFNIEFQQAKRDFVRKTLLTLVGMVIGVAALLFLSTQWAAAGVGLILVSAYSFYHATDKYLSSKYYLTQATEAISSAQ